MLAERRLRGGLPVYRLDDYLNEDIKGTVYQSELQKVDVRDDDVFKVEKTLKTRDRGLNEQYFVKWLHWPSILILESKQPICRIFIRIIH